MENKTDPANILRSVDIVFQVLANASPQHEGLFPSVAERHFGRVLQDWPLPAVIPGQRNSDRSPQGCNLSHDVPLLATLHGLQFTTGKGLYSELRDRYLHTFATVCAPASPTGLLPWGEHSFWRLTDGCIGNSYLLQYREQANDAGLPLHHQLTTLPRRDWEDLQRSNPQLLPRFLDGLDGHWMDEERTKFNRHAPITQFIRGYPFKRMSKLTGKPLDSISGSDFPSASGMFIADYATGLALVPDPDPAWRTAMNRFADFWWERRNEQGLCPKSSSGDSLKWNGTSLGQTLNFARGLQEAGELLEDQELLKRSTSLLNAVLQVKQPDIGKGWLWLAFHPDGTPAQHTQAWAGNRGNAITASTLIRLLDLSSRQGSDQALPLVEQAASVYHEARIPRETLVRAGDPASVIALCTELYRITRKPEWRDTALLHATDALELFFDCPLPRMAIGRSHYENQQGSSHLVHALARLSFIAEDNPVQGGLERPSI